MSRLARLKSRALRLRKEATALYYASRDPGLPLLPKIVILIALWYALSPIDLIPDFIPVLGYLDDIIIIPALISLAIRLIPEKIMVDARTRAEREPVALKKNLFFAALFILFWLAIMAVLVLSIVKTFR